MEILAEILIQTLFWLCELLFTVLGEGLFDWGWNKRAEKRKVAARDDQPETAGPVLTATGYAAFGAIFGVVTLLIAPSHMIASPALRWLNIAGSTLLAGFMLAKWREFQAKPEREEHFALNFANGCCLAFALAVTRLALAR